MNLWHTKGFKWKIILSVLVFLLGLVCSTVFSVRMHQNALEARRKTAQLNATTYANYLIEDFSQAIGVTDCVYVGDSEVDVLTAKNAGVPCLSVLWGFRDREQIGGSWYCETVDRLVPMLEEMACGK